MCRHEETCDDYGFAIASSHLSQDNCACCIICCIAIQYCSSLHLIAFPEELCGLETCRHNPNMAAKLLQQMKLFFMLKIDHHQYSSIHMAVMNFPSYQYGVMLQMPEHFSLYFLPVLCLNIVAPSPWYSTYTVCGYRASCSRVDDQAVCERDRGGILLSSKFYQGTPGFLEVRYITRKANAFMRLASEGRQNVPRILELFGIQHTILHRS